MRSIPDVQRHHKPPHARVMARVTVEPGPLLTDCWRCWLGLNGKGYSVVSDHYRPKASHRVMYEHLVGLIPDGLQLDHLCRVRNCVNPDHLEPVTNRENSLRGASPFAVAHRTGLCLRGHPLTFRGKQGRCPVCALESNRRRRRAKRNAI